jgi:hypothetical protein
MYSYEQLAAIDSLLGLLLMGLGALALSFVIVYHSVRDAARYDPDFDVN